MDSRHVFHVADYVIFVVTIVVSLGIGIFYAFSGGRQRTTSEFLVGNRKMSVLPVAISLMVSFESSIMMLGIPAEIYTYGIQWIMANFGFFIADLASVKIMVPLIYPLKITSAYEVCYMGIVLFGPAIALEAVTGFPLYSSILVVAGASMIYTAIGGIKAVIWTDVFQSIVMVAGILAILIKGTMVVGGVGRTWEIAKDNGRLNFFDFDTNPMTRHTFWNLFVGSIIRGFSFVFNQSSVQRISSTSSLKDAKNVLLITAPAFLITMSFAIIEGIVAFAYYYTLRCDPLASKQIRNSNQIIPLMVMDIFKGLPGMPGLFLASLFSASLSTLSSGLSSVSALFWQDFIKPHTKPMSEFKATAIAKLSVVIFGAIAVGVAYLVAQIGGTLIQGAFTGCITGVVFVFWIALGKTMSPGVKRTPRLPAAPVDLCSSINLMNDSILFNYNSSSFIDTTTSLMTSSITESVQTAVEPQGLDRLYSISYMWLGLIGIFFTMFIASIVSLCTGIVKPKDSNPLYLVSLIDELLPFLPENFRKCFRFGYNYDKTEVCYMGIVLFGPAIALEAVTGFPLYSSILVVAGASVIYTAIGGIKAVIWTDVFQSIVMFAGIFAVLIKGTMVVGGVGKTWRIANDNGRLNFFVVILFTAPAFLVTISFAVIEGVVAFAYYFTLRCDPLESKQIRDPNQIIPLMVMDIFKDLPGMPGLFLASLFSASLSTLSSGLSSLSALFWQDFVKPHTKPMSEVKATIIAKVSVVVFGAIAVGIAFLVAQIGGTLTQITGTILSSFGGPLTGLFFAGCFCPWVNAKGAITGCITSVVFVFWIAAGKTMSPGVKRTPRLPAAPTDQCIATNLMNESALFNYSSSSFYETTSFMTSTIADPIVEAVEPEGLNRLYSISYMWLGLIGIFFTMVIASIVSFCTGIVKPKDSNPLYLISLMDEILPCLPESFRKWYRFGYNYDKTEVFISLSKNRSFVFELLKFV
ncbi:hypothetical protein FSP39_011031 [Pinctada imbricata]|uniref:Sodium-dependent multivitamin transporter n=1 Tax=Pinctada imbricata TaxID=66713 RepID=A0AA88Y041_PINIB|nr:hypothetical protein FSP39_011031 [Pinctada imbricata]